MNRIDPLVAIGGHKFDIVPSTREGAVLFVMSIDTGEFVFDALKRVNYPNPKNIIRVGYGQLTLPNSIPQRTFSTARLVKGRQIFAALDSTRTDSEYVYDRKVAACLQQKMADIALDLVGISALGSVRDSDNKLIFNPDSPSTLWKSKEIESYLHAYPVIAPQLPGEIKPETILLEGGELDEVPRR